MVVFTTVKTIITLGAGWTIRGRVKGLKLIIKSLRDNTPMRSMENPMKKFLCLIFWNNFQNFSKDIFLWKLRKNSSQWNSFMIPFIMEIGIKINGKVMVLWSREIRLIMASGRGESFTLTLMNINNLRVNLLSINLKILRRSGCKNTLKF